MKKFNVGIISLTGLVALLASCATLPEAGRGVAGFDKERYLGKWYEIARFDFTFERNLDNTTAEYSLRPDGKIAVKNRGFNYVTGKWQEARGKARFRGDETRAELQVSFFGPFYADYTVLALAPDYSSALVSGGSLDYLWILSRTTTLPEATKREYLDLASSAGYAVQNLVWVRHDR